MKRGNMQTMAGHGQWILAQAVRGRCVRREAVLVLTIIGHDARSHSFRITSVGGESARSTFVVLQVVIDRQQNFASRRPVCM